MNSTDKENGGSDDARASGKGSGRWDRGIHWIIVAFVVSLTALAGGVWAAEKYLGWRAPPTVRAIIDWFEK